MPDAMSVRRPRAVAAATQLLALLLAALMVAACGAVGASRTIALDTLNESGVTGSVTLVEVGQNRTRVDVDVEPGTNPDMPAHIHPGTCVNLVPQVKYPLSNVVDGASSTVVPASLTELLAGDLAINLHRSNEDLRTTTACADLR